jgi:2-keto-4-pentenoate hydratase/2-oxohepta-3-ene-1,7-dioic acid hydratase in catechol pathway
VNALVNGIPTDSIESLNRLAPPSLDESAVELLSPITRNQQLICQGANYRSHMLESGLDPNEKALNMIFRKASSSIVPATSDVVRPAHVRLLDYEIELGVVLGADVTGAKTFMAADLHEVIAVIVIVNDYSARDVQIPEMLFYKGKSYRTCMRSSGATLSSNDGSSRPSAPTSSTARGHPLTAAVRSRQKGARAVDEQT